MRFRTEKAKRAHLAHEQELQAVRGKLAAMTGELGRIQAASAPAGTAQKLEKAEAACTAKDTIITSLRCACHILACASVAVLLVTHARRAAEATD